MNSHKMIEQSRRDDIESLGNIMVYLKKGHLPWFKRFQANFSKKKRYEAITKKKRETSI